MLFSKNFGNIDFTDIETLVREKEREGWVLDYKQQFPSNEKIAALVSAFANTYGGYIVVGVEEESDGSNRPKGLKTVSDGGLTDRLDSICHTIIEPPVFCQSKYLDSSDGSVRVFLIKVPESDLTPHAVEKNSIVYVRINAQKKPLIEKADLDRQTWLKNRRKKHELLRESLSLTARQRSKQVLDRVGPTGGFQIETLVVPRYPREPLIPYSDMYSFLKDFRSSFGTLGMCDATNVHDGLVVKRMDRASNHYTEFNCYGLYYNCAVVQPEVVESCNALCLHSVIANLTTNLYNGMEILLQLGFRGSVNVRCQLNGFKSTEVRCAFNPDREFYTLRDHRCEIEDALTLEAVLEIGSYQELIKVYVIDFIARLLYAYGVSEDVQATQLYDAFMQSWSN